MGCKHRNENGYALVTVLLAITIFMIMGFSLMNHSLNTSEQIMMTESNVQSIDLAEMGAEYYKYWLLNTSEKNRSITPEILDELMNGKEFLAEGIGYRVENVIPELNGKILSISYESIGIINNEDGSKIKSELEIKLGEEHADGSQSPIQDPKPESECDFKKNQKKFDQENCLYKGILDLTKGGNVKMSKSVLKIDGDLKIKNINEDLENSLLYITRDLSITNNLNGFKNADIYVGGNVTFGGNFNNGKNITLVVEGNATFSGHLKNQENTRICVNLLKKLANNTQIDGDIIIYANQVDENVKSKHSNLLNDKIIITDNALSKCSNGSPDDEWESPTVIKENYIY